MTIAPPAAPPLPPAPAGPVKRSGLAIASLVCGIIGPLTVGLASLVAVILGIVGLVKISKSQGALGGKVMAIVGIVLGGLFLLALPFIALIAAIATPALIRARDMAEGAMAMNNLKQMSTAAQTYAVTHRGALPPADTWPQCMCETMGLTEEVLQDPADPEAGRGYGMNGAVAGTRLMGIPAPSRTVLFFECEFGSPPSGGPDCLPPAPRHPKGYLIAFCDGHVEAVPLHDLDRLIWDPKADDPNK